MVRQSWSDEDLAKRLQERDPDALETLISRYSREIFYFIRLVLDGIGVAQDAEERSRARCHLDHEPTVPGLSMPASRHRPCVRQSAPVPKGKGEHSQSSKRCCRARGHT